MCARVSWKIEAIEHKYYKQLIYMAQKPEVDSRDRLNGLLTAYVNENVGGFARARSSDELELEVRFGKGHRITRTVHDGVVAKLVSSGFTSGSPSSLLRIGTDYLDARTGNRRPSNIRTEIRGMSNISAYCRDETLMPGAQLRPGTRFVRKTNFRGARGYVDPVDFWDFGFRVSLQTEETLGQETRAAQDIIANWNDAQKTFRYITRHRLSHPSYPFVVDVSTVKESKRDGKRYVPSYTLKESGVLDSPENYEIEIEVVNAGTGVGTPYDTPESLGTALRRMIKLVLSGVQRTNYPVSRDEMRDVAVGYRALVYGKSDDSRGDRLYPRDFVGPSGLTLQARNAAPENPEALIPNIRSDYTVTDKADGDRKLLYVSSWGRMYLIDTNMNIQFTGATSQNVDLRESILDGEHILHNRKGEFINLYAAFDVYYVGGDDTRSRPLVSPEDASTEGRLATLARVVGNLKAASVVEGGLAPIRVQSKAFYASTPVQSIFQACAAIVQKQRDNLIEYETDGLVFTPANLAVGASRPGEEASKPGRTTWDWSLKWKPPEWNTVDFLVTVQKSATGQDLIGNVFQGGTDVSSTTQFTQYKTLILRVGFDEKRHGYINPCQAVVDDRLPSDTGAEETGYRPVQFFPTNPSDPEAGICQVLLRESPTGDKEMFTESNEVIETNTIVEFRYDFARSGRWRWVPVRIRHDKTADFRAGGRNYGNAFHVADSNWHSIHNPVTEAMITTGDGIPDELADDDVYYNRLAGASGTRGLRDFHNLFVKKTLITATSPRGGTLVDLAVGKGGDLPKWISAKLGFVLGMDLSRDNIENRLDGACARFLNYTKKFKRMPKALFVVGNAAVNFRSGEAVASDKGKQIVRAVFGNGPKDATELGKGVYDQYGVGENGFDVCSVQFALHYMLSSQEAFEGFVRNVSETTKVGGYFIGTCYDGESVFRMLRNTPVGESVSIMDGGHKLWEVTKRYDREDFPASVASLGYAIDVYQESINKTAREYLVNFEYLTRVLENYGLVPISRPEAEKLGLPSSSGLFDELFAQMMNDIERSPRSRNEYGAAMGMSDQEKRISYLNRYFVFRKVRAVDAASIPSQPLYETNGDDRTQTALARDAVETALEEAPPKKAPRKRGKRLKLKEEP